MCRTRKAWLPNRTGRRPGRPGWYVYWQEHGADGRRLRVRTFKTSTEARHWLRSFNALLVLESAPTVAQASLLDAGRAFLAATSNRAAETRRQYRMSIIRFVETVGDMPVARVGRAEIDRFIGHLAQQCSESTAAKHLRGVRRLLGWCLETGYRTARVPRGTSPPRSGLVRQKPRIDHADLARILAAVDTDDRRMAIQIAATTGLDRGVIAGIRCCDVDLLHRQFHLIRSKVNRPVNPYIHDGLVPAISRRLDRTQPTRRLLRGVRRTRRLDWFRQAVETAGLPALRFVDLRTYAANWLRAILGDFETQKLLGHSTPAVTARHYWQENPAAQRLVSRSRLPGSQAARKTARTTKRSTDHRPASRTPAGNRWQPARAAHAG